MSTPILFAAIVLLPATLMAQSYKAPRTADGQPDLQGIWDFRTITPMERPKQLGTKAFFTEQEAAAYEQEENRRRERKFHRDCARPRRRSCADHSLAWFH